MKPYFDFFKGIIYVSAQGTGSYSLGADSRPLAVGSVLAAFSICFSALGYVVASVFGFDIRLLIFLFLSFG